MKSYPNLELIEKISENNLPSLCTVTLAALELFTKEGLPKIKFPVFKNPIIVGSGNAKVTSEILFSNVDAIFADENNYENVLKRKPDGAIIFSASGSKHAPIIAKKYKDKKLKTTLVTCTPNSPAEIILGEQNTIITNKNREPYTYNTSTYMGWILAKTRENPEEIYDFIKKKIISKIPKNLKDYNGFLLITPNQFSNVNQLFETKFIELFGRKVARDVKTYEELKHAITVVPNKKELCIKFGKGDDVIFEGDVLNIPLPENINIGAMMAIGYYVIGNIQEQMPQYFKKNIKEYVKTASSKSFGKGISVIVE
ncbi:MAG: hypothetical protein PF569_03130 [Candidatus Woesearchaeota archaeon]|jgi:hypothetical protein|nr:hypothetical protein [Candidatus Woesearchaeota archaeon]